MARSTERKVALGVRGVPISALQMAKEDAKRRGMTFNSYLRMVFVSAAVDPGGLQAQIARHRIERRRELLKQSPKSL